MKKSYSIILRALAAAAAAVALLYFVLKDIDWNAFVEGLRLCSWGHVAGAVLCAGGIILARARRWQLLLRPLSPNMDFLTVFNSYNIGNAVNWVLPGSGEIARCGFVKTSENSFQGVLGTIVQERAWDALCIVILLALTLVTGWDTVGGFFMGTVLEPLRQGFDVRTALITLVVVVVVATGFVLLLRRRRSFPFLGKVRGVFLGFWDGLKSFGEVDGKAEFLGLTTAIWVLSWAGMRLVMASLPGFGDLDGGDALLTCALGNIASVVPVPGSLGAYHYLLAAALGQLHDIPWEEGVLYAMLCHEPSQLLRLALGLGSYIDENIRRAGISSGSVGEQD